jgi:uncharacterized membrane protein YkvI
MTLPSAQIEPISSSLERKHHVIVGWLHLIAGVFICVCISIIWLSLVQLAPLFEKTGIPILISLYFGPISICLLVLGLVEIVAAIALILRRTWARAVLLGLCAVLCLAVPLGTLLAGYTVWALVLHRSDHPVVNPVERVG